MATRREALGALTATAGLGLFAGKAFGAGAEEVIVPFELTRDRAWTIVKFDGHGWFKMIIDTGADRFSLDDKLCRDAGLKHLSSVEVEGATGHDYVNTYVAQANIANVVRDDNAAVFGLAHGMEDGLQGLIPAALLGNVLFDFVQKRMHLSHKTPAGVEGFTVVPYVQDRDAKQGHIQTKSVYPTVRAELDGRPVTLRIDTGAPQSAYLFAS